MKILFLTPYVPSKRAGGENFTRLLLQNLAMAGNKIDLIYYKYKEDKCYEPVHENIRVLKIIENSTLLKLWNCLHKPLMYPIFTIRFSKLLLNFVKRQMAKEQYDLLYLDHSQMFLYGRYFKNIPKLLMAHDVMGQRFERQGNALIRKLVLKNEGDLMRVPNSTIFSFSDKDRNIIKSLYGVDSEVTHFFLDDMVQNAMPSKVENRLVFFGKWKRPDNFDGLAWFFKEVYPSLDKETEISIIGGWLPDDFQKQHVDGSRVKYLGFVDNPYDLIANSKAVISPLFSGAGVKVKVVETLACGTPVIGNDIAFEGIDKSFGEFILHADSANEYLEQIIAAGSVSLETRLQYKESFYKKYSEDSITEYLNIYDNSFNRHI